MIVSDSQGGAVTPPVTLVHFHGFMLCSNVPLCCQIAGRAAPPGQTKRNVLLFASGIRLLVDT